MSDNESADQRNVDKPAQLLNNTVHRGLVLFKSVDVSSVNVKIYGECSQSIVAGRAKESLKIVHNSHEWIPALVDTSKAKVQNGQSLRVHPWEIAPNE
jgi:hypothetical protein